MSGIPRLGVRFRILWGPAAVLLTLASVFLGLLPSNAVPFFFGPIATANSSPSLGPGAKDSVFADFDLDGRLDHATLISTGGERGIRLALASGPERRLSFYSPWPFPGFMQALDLNGDEKLDLAWAPVESAAPLVAWLGDGKGNFARLNVRELPLGLPQALYVPFESGTSPTSSQAASQTVIASKLDRERLARSAAMRQLRLPKLQRHAPSVWTRVADHQTRWQARILNLPPPIASC